jgi:tetratricopeptide (TPR) repeat protein
VVEASIEIVEEVTANGDGVTTDVRGRIARALADAASYRRQRFHAKAIETLRGALDLAPRALEVRTLLRDVLLEAGMQREAIAEMIAIASLLIDALDGDSAAQMLQDVLGMDPQNARAADMLRELGYELVEEPAAAPASARYQADLPPMREQYPSYDPEAPLPSYDLEEIGPEAVSAHYSDPGLRAAAPVHALEEIDDPFGAEAAPLPQFPLEPAPESEAQFDLVAREPAAYAGDDDLHTDVGEPETANGQLMPAEESPTATRPQPTGAELEEALEEADFFASRGLYDDARTILEEQLARLPKNRLVMERLAELEAQERNAQGGSGTREKPNAPTITQPPPEDRSFDIAASLGEVEPEDRQSNVGANALAGDKQIDVEEVFAKFKEGVAKQISVDDAQSHYDLGVAYKEMGLIDDSIRELATAARDPKRECICQSMIGMIEIERGNTNEAIDAFMRGLHANVRTPDQETALCFELGSAYEAKKMTKDALGYYQRVQRRDPNYRDVSERIRRLSASTTKAPPRAAAVGADDEFDRAFDDIIGGGKLP